MSLRLLTVVVVALLALGACSGGDPAADEPNGGSSGGDWGFDASSDPDEQGDDGSTISVPTGTPADPAQYPDAYTGNAFATPTGNIVCFIDEAAQQWGCIIKERTYTEPAGAEECLQSFGNGFSSVQGSPLTPLCRGGVIAAVENGTGTVLPYGHTLTIGAVTCLSEETGVTCVDQSSGRSLFISKARYETA